jgi:SulP family sulfate permease
MPKMKSLTRFLPFLRWFPVTNYILRTDMLAGLAVALVIVPKAMAYAQLAGLPAYFGLYAAFIPVIIGALFGSSSQLATGPVAVISLMTASALTPLALPGSDQFIALAILLALMVGIFQLTLGVFKLGVVVNFISHPVIIGFTNAAAIIIALSQLSKLLGVSMGSSGHFIQDIWGVILQAGHLHLPTLLMGTGAIVIMLAAKRYSPKAPGVLIAVIIATSVSWAIGFERNGSARPEQIDDPEARALIDAYQTADARVGELKARVTTKSRELKDLHKHRPDASRAAAALNFEIELLRLDLKNVEDENSKRLSLVRQMEFERVPGVDDGTDTLYRAGKVPPTLYPEGPAWHIKNIDPGEVKLVGGGEVVGTIPSGLPSLVFPSVSRDSILALLSSAFVIALVGFMEAVAMSKAIATKTRERINPNQELIGQGLANITGSISQSYPVCGSFSGSALNLDAGAKTGLASVFNGIFVMVTLLLLTPLLYHLPQAVLAAIIMMAVTGLINFNAIKHAWQTHFHDGAAAVVTFAATLLLAPHLDQGILFGAGLALILYLLRTMKPRVVILSRHADGTLRDAKVHNLPTSEHIIAVRFDGSLYFANVPYFEETILEAVANKPKAKYLLVVGDGINQLDASGEEVIRHLVLRLRDSGITMVFSGLKKQVLDIMQHTGLYSEIGAQNFFRTEDMALDAIYQWIDDTSFDRSFCPLRRT